MRIKAGQFTTKNPNHVISMATDRTVLYSNEADESLLHEWRVAAGEKLPPNIGDFVIQESGANEVANLELSEVVDVQAIQSIMDDFYKLSHVPMSLDDLKGNVLIGVGWQDICTKFHRVHPETCKHCIESSTQLSKGIPPGEFKMFKCKNNMWDMATPIVVGGQHVGNIFSGQFFFDDEPLNYEFFRSQARKYGFNEKEYITALEKVPQMSRESVETGISYLMKLANMISQLSYSNTMLSKSLTERDALLAALQESEKRERARSDELAVVLDAVPVAVMIAHDPKAIKMTGNRLSYEWIRFPEGTNISKVAPEEKRLDTHKLFKDGVKISLEDMPLRVAASGKEVHDYELDVVYPDGTKRHVLCNARPLRDEQRNLRGAVAALIDITERKQAEKALQESETHFRALAENSPDLITRFDRQHRYAYANPAFVISHEISLDEIIGKTQSEFGWGPEKVKFWEEYLENTFVTGKTETLEYKYISPQGKKYYFNTKIVPEFADGKISSVLAISRDITDIKESEAKLKETLDNLEKLVKDRTEELEKAYNSLKESEKGLAEAQKMAHVGNWDWNLLSGEMYWSDEMYRIFGRTPQKSSSSYSEILSCTHPDDRVYVDNAVKRALEGDSFAIDHRLVLAGGDERTVYAQGKIIFDEKNVPVRMRGTVQDITERKKAEEEISNLANIVESSSDAIGTISQGLFASWNKGAEQVYGYSQEEILGKPVSIAAPSYLGDETKKLCERVKHGESISNYETVRLRKDGKFIDVSITLSPIYDLHGNLTAISFISRDISARKKAEEKLRESEEKYRNIVETANEGIVIIDAEFKSIYVNEKMADMVGYSREDCTFKPIWEFISEESRDIVKNRLISRHQVINDSYEFKLIRKDGSPLWVFTNAKSLFNKDGRFIGSLSMLTDITKRKEAEQALANFEIAREKEIHHRIKNNLQVVSSLLDFHAFKFKGRKNIKETEVIDSFRESKNRVVSMALIHEELYKGSGLKTINFSAYVEKLANNLLSIYKTGNTDIILNKDLEEDLFFDMDTAIPLGTMINEIVSNSLKYAFSGKDKGEIQIKLHREENRECIKDITENSKSTSFVLTVSDNGVGIPENLNIEELDSLGLQLVTTLVNKLGGELKLKRNNGTEFVVRFTVTEKDN